jgi:hypothetical protein
MRVEHRLALWWTGGIWEAAQAPNGERVGQWRAMETGAGKKQGKTAQLSLGLLSGQGTELNE